MDESGAKGRRRRPISARWAAALDDRVVRSLRERPQTGRVRTFGSAMLIFGSALVVLGVAALFATGAVMLLLGPGLWRLLGVVIAATAVVIRPRWRRHPDAFASASRADQPELFRLVDAVATAAGAPKIDVIVLASSFDASCSRRGVRRQVVLTIGLPLWAALSSRGRVALLAELLARPVTTASGHDAVATPALTSLSKFADLFGERRSEAFPPSPYRVTSWTFTERSGAVAAAIVCAPVWLATAGLRWALAVASGRTRQRAEYHADAVAVPVAGTAGVEEYLTTLLLADQVSTAIRRWMRVGAGLGLLTEVADDVRAQYRDRLDGLATATARRRASLRAEHAPLGRRLQLVRSWPWQEPAVPALGSSVDAADRGLGGAMHRAERVLAHQP